MANITSIGDRLKHVLETKSQELRVAGAVVAVAVGGQQTAIAHGSANLNTAQPFTPDTGFLLGSVTKVLVTTMLLRLVERGVVDLDVPVARYLPEFKLRDADAAHRITVRMLVNHTNGIDADALGPTAVRGRDSAKSYTEVLARMGVLFEPGSFVHYTNPGFVLAGRIIEEHTQRPFEHAIEQELFGPCGMGDATAVQTQAFLRRTAVGAFTNAETGTSKATRMFTLGESLAGAGSTLIVSVADMLTFGRMHLNGGVAPNGKRVLSRESVAAMQTPTFDTGIPQAPPVGLGWWMFPIAGAVAPWHGGGSPGGASSFCILPEYDAVIVSFATAGGRAELNDLLHNAVIEELTGRRVEPPFNLQPTPPASGVAGEYQSFQSRIVVDHKGDSLLVTTHFEPYDEDHAQVLDGYDGGDTKPKPVTYRSVAPGQFAPEGVTPAALSGFYGRMGLLAALPPASGRRAGLHSKFRYTPKIR